MFAKARTSVSWTRSPLIAAKTAFRFFVFFEEGALPKTTREKVLRSKFFDRVTDSAPGHAQVR
jgi:hypothetical protein